MDKDKKVLMDCLRQNSIKHSEPEKRTAKVGSRAFQRIRFYYIVFRFLLLELNILNYFLEY